MTNEVEILTPALEGALLAWEEWKKGKSFISQYPPEPEVLNPLATAIEACDDFKKASGRPIFSGNSVVIITGSALAEQLLYRADAQYRLGIRGAIEWLVRVLTTTHTIGNYAVAIWGLIPDKDVEVSKGSLLQSYETAPDSPIKKRLKDLTRKGWDGAVWHSTRFYDTPGAILTQTVPDFPYLGRPDLSYQTLHELDGKTKELLAFLQASLTGVPLVGASWFSYDDHELDFNSAENHLRWVVPEVEPTVPAHVPAESGKLAGVIAALSKLPGDYRNKFMRSTDRFALSHCRHRRVDTVLDLAIAYELLIGSRGDGPIGWKVSLRSAQLIGGTLDQRLQLRESVNALYKLRNHATHGGMPTSVEAAEQSATIFECNRVYRLLVDAILAQGDEPTWQKLELEPRVRE